MTIEDKQSVDFILEQVSLLVSSKDKQIDDLKAEIERLNRHADDLAAEKAKYYNLWPQTNIYKL